MNQKVYILDEEKIEAARMELRKKVKNAIREYRILVMYRNHTDSDYQLMKFELETKILDARGNLQRFNDIFGIEG